MKRPVLSHPVFLLFSCFVAAGHLMNPAQPAEAQEIEYDDRMGSNKDFDMCEDFRFKRITKLVNDGKISQQQGYNIWKRIQSDKAAVTKVLNQATTAGELTEHQAARLLPLLDMEVTYMESRHGWFGQPKELGEGQFQAGEVSPKNRAAVYQRLVAANERGEMYDYDVASIMKQLYAGFDPESAPVEEVAEYRGALNPRIGQSGSQARVLQNAQMERDRKGRRGYGQAEIEITDPADWKKQQEKTIYSGPQPGERVTSISAINLRGDSAGRELDPVETAGDKLHLMFFVGKSRTFGRFLGQLGKQLQVIETNSQQPWAMSVIVCTDDANEAQKSFTVLDQRYPQNVLVALSKDGSAGPPAYGLDKNLTATVLIVKDGKVLHNFAHAGDAFYAQPHILGALADAMQIDHATLRQFISDTPGDAAGAAERRKRSMNGAGSTAAAGFRQKLGPLVRNQRLTRTQAGELLQLSNQPNALQAKLASMVKAKELTQAEADALTPPSQTGDQGTKAMTPGNVKCPVMPSRTAKREFAISHAGGQVYFCCKNCLAKFSANPKKYEAAAQQQMALTGQTAENKKH